MKFKVGRKIRSIEVMEYVDGQLEGMDQMDMILGDDGPKEGERITKAQFDDLILLASEYCEDGICGYKVE